MATLLEAKSLTKHYGQTIALESVDFVVQDGITGLLGPNGAGKSTAIKLFLGLLKPTSGSAEVLGELPYESLGIRARLGSGGIAATVRGAFLKPTPRLSSITTHAMLLDVSRFKSF